MADNHHNAKFKASQKSGVCYKCKKTYNIEELQYYIDGCNYAITNNTKPICIYCEPLKYIEMTTHEVINSYMTTHGVEFDNDGKFENDNCIISISKENYNVLIKESNSSIHSSDLSIYWIVGIIKHYSLIEDLKAPIHFGRWLLKHCDTTQQDGCFCWIYKGAFYDTAEIFEIFKTE